MVLKLYDQYSVLKKLKENSPNTDIPLDSPKIPFLGSEILSKILELHLVFGTTSVLNRF